MKILKNKKTDLQARSIRLHGSQFLWLMALSVMLWVGTAHAQSDAYSIEVAVTDRSDKEQKSAYQVALRRVLLNNSGDKTLLNRNSVRSGLNEAESYVSSFNYRTPPPGTMISSDTPITPQVRRTGEATQLMMVTFDRTLVRELIDSSASKSSGSERAAPTTRRANSAMVWLLIQDTGRDIRISDPEAVNVQARAREIAGSMGISLVFPTGDDTDKAAVTTDDMLNMDTDAVLAGSERYEQSTILFGSLARNGSRGWRGDWQKLSVDGKSASNYNATTLDDALQQGLALLVGGEAADSSYQYGGTASSDTEGLVWVGSVESLNDYASLMRFLEAVPNVATVYPKEVRETTMVFAVLPRAALRDIENAASQQDWIQRSAPYLGASSDLASSADLALELNR